MTISLTQFTVTGNYQSVAGEQIWDTAGTPTVSPISGTVTFTPLFASGEAAKLSNALLVMQPVQAVIRDGQLQRNGQAGVKLIANTANLNLASLYYRVTFFNLYAPDGASITLNSFDFSAPTGSSTIELTDLTPEPGTPAIGRVLSASAPSSASATGTAGQITYDGTYIYVCVAANTWRRATLSSW